MNWINFIFSSNKVDYFKIFVPSTLQVLIINSSSNNYRLFLIHCETFSETFAIKIARGFHFAQSFFYANVNQKINFPTRPTSITFFYRDKLHRELSFSRMQRLHLSEETMHECTDLSCNTINLSNDNGK